MTDALTTPVRMDTASRSTSLQCVAINEVEQRNRIERMFGHF